MSKGSVSKFHWKGEIKLHPSKQYIANKSSSKFTVGQFFESWKIKRFEKLFYNANKDRPQFKNPEKLFQLPTENI